MNPTTPEVRLNRRARRIEAARMRQIGMKQAKRLRRWRQFYRALDAIQGDYARVAATAGTIEGRIRLGEREIIRQTKRQKKLNRRLMGGLGYWLLATVTLLFKWKRLTAKDVHLQYSMVSANIGDITHRIGKDREQLADLRKQMTKLEDEAEMENKRLAQKKFNEAKGAREKEKTNVEMAK